MASAAPDFLVFYMLTCQYSILYVNVSPAVTYTWHYILVPRVFHYTYPWETIRMLKMGGFFLVNMCISNRY
jgi:hypothetical protein